jgi:exonuclease V gamma subunit
MLALPNPCRYYWGDIMDGRDLLHAQRRRQPLRKGQELSHMPLQRLRAETVRDCLLFVSGQLDPAIEGFTGPPDRGNGGGPAGR